MDPASKVIKERKLFNELMHVHVYKRYKEKTGLEMVRRTFVILGLVK